jgi:ferritin heavy chain
MASNIRQNYHEECEALINKQINMEMYASYVYLSMASYFSRDDQALMGFAKFFRKSSNEERDHSIMFMDYQNLRGGKCVFQDIAKPTPSEWGSPLEAVMAALELEKKVNQSILDLHAAASKRNDPHLNDYLESNFLNEQVDAIKELSDLITKMKRAGDGLGLHLMDKEMA